MHASDCATNNAPAYPAGACDCSFAHSVAPEPAGRYQPGDCVVEQIGLIKLADGREMMGILLCCPAGPPHHQLSMALDGTPFTLTPRNETPF